MKICFVDDVSVTNPHLLDYSLFTCCIGKFAKKVNSSYMSPRMVTYRCTKNLDINAFKEDIRNAPWSVLKTFDDINDVFNAFQTLFTDIWNSHAPMYKDATSMLHGSTTMSSLANESVIYITKSI